MIDLHIHTRYSDGEHTPRDVVSIAKRSGADIIAITDHDSVFGISEAVSEGLNQDVLVVPGIEITAFEDEEVHVLGYNIDYNSEKIHSYVEYVSEERKREILRIFRKLRGFGIKLSEEDVYKFREGEIVTVWHFAKAVCEKGYALSVKEALDKFFFGSIADEVRYEKISVNDAIKLICDIGGVPVLAHPGRLCVGRDEVIRKIESWQNGGLKGIEAIYSLNSVEENKLFLDIARRFDLGITIGSDYHGENVKPAIKIGTGVDGNMAGDSDLENEIKKLLGV